MKEKSQPNLKPSDSLTSIIDELNLIQRSNLSVAVTIIVFMEWEAKRLIWY